MLEFNKLASMWLLPETFFVFSTNRGNQSNNRLSFAVVSLVGTCSTYNMHYIMWLRLVAVITNAPIG